MVIAAILAITQDPALRMLFTRMEPIQIRWPWNLRRKKDNPPVRSEKFASKVATTLMVGTYYPEEKHPVSKVLFRFYEPACRFVLKHRKGTLITALVLVLTTVPVYLKLGSEFMPPLWEGGIPQMPTTLPGISVTEAQNLLQKQDQILKSFPEVASVFGKAGRMESSTDPAPFSMMETVVTLKPEGEWRKIKRWYSGMPDFVKAPLRVFWPERVSHEDLINQMDEALKIPGMTNAWTMPIKARIDMLSTGVRTPLGIKILGSDLEKIEGLGTRLEMILKDIPGTRSVFAERAAGGYFLDFDLKREELARYGISVKDAQMVVLSAIGGENVTTTVEGRERYPVNVRYPRELRDDVEKLK